MAYNRLISESSTYLKAHAHQAIDWYPWGEEALEKAKSENKLIFVSIGFSACHWCHEISRSCFENEEIVQTLNRYFINIKVDREERPDVDQFFMNIIEIVTNSGGWPISCFTLPDGSPIYGGTYFPSDQFMEVILGLHQIYEDEPEKLEEIAVEMNEMLKNSDIITAKKPIETATINDINLIIEPWRRKFDLVNGGTIGEPKFPLPVSLIFILYSSYYLEDKTLEKYVETTLNNLARGGIYDHLEGGFFRYTDDTEWKKPHFEKMLFDNAQLIVVFSLAHRNNPNPLYKSVIEKTIHFMLNAGLSKNNMFYSSFDAESNNVEGDYYTWQASELKKELKENYDLAKDYYGIVETDDIKNVLFVNESIEQLSKKYNITEEECAKKINNIEEILLKIRKTRLTPTVDTQVIAGWNALAISALCEAYRTLGDKMFLNHALHVANYLIDNYMDENYKMYRIVENKIPACLDDYSYTANALTKLYRITGDDKFLQAIKGIVNYTLEHFYDTNSGMFFFTDDTIPSSLPRMMDFVDKAYPSSNSVMARVLTVLSLIEGDESYYNIALQMISNMKDQMPGAGPYVAYWANLLYSYIYKPILVFLPKEQTSSIQKHFTPNLLVFPDNMKVKGLSIPCYQAIPDKKLKKIDGNYSKLADYARMNKKT